MLRFAVLSLFCLLILLLLGGASSHLFTERQQAYFEGQIVYFITYTSSQPGINIESLKDALGSEMRLTFKKGSYKKEYRAPDDRLLSTRYLDLRREKSYLFKAGLDTIFWFDITSPDTKLTFTVLPDTTVLNKRCTVLETVTYHQPSNTEAPVRLKGRYYYSQDLAVNPDWYSSYREANFNVLIKAAGGLIAKSYRQGLYWEEHLAIKSITRRKVKRSEIRPPVKKGAPLRKL